MLDKFEHFSRQITKAQDAALEEYLIEYFGSAEEAIEFVKFFTIDISETKYVPDTSMSSDEFKLTATVVYRVRVKSEEELEASHVERPWPEVIVTMQRIEDERNAMLDKKWDESLIRSGTKDAKGAR